MYTYIEGPAKKIEETVDRFPAKNQPKKCLYGLHTARSFFGAKYGPEILLSYKVLIISFLR